jgi:uncharacterized protein
MHFLLIAYDGTDEQAPLRRQQARERHLVSIEALKKEGRALYGAAILNEKQEMAGSVVIYQFPSRGEFDAYLEEEPYVTAGIWQRIEVIPCRVPPVFLE